MDIDSLGLEPDQIDRIEGDLRAEIEGIEGTAGGSDAAVEVLAEPEPGPMPEWADWCARNGALLVRAYPFGDVILRLPPSRFRALFDEIRIARLSSVTGRIRPTGGGSTQDGSAGGPAPRDNE